MENALGPRKVDTPLQNLTIYILQRQITANNIG